MCLNCVVSTYIGCLFCRKGCDAEKVRNGFTFMPPQPSYKVEADPEDAERCRKRLRYRIPALSNNSDYREAARVSEVIVLTTRTGSRIPIVWFRKGCASQVQAPRPQPSAACQEGSSQASSARPGQAPAAPTAASREVWPPSACEPPAAAAARDSAAPLTVPDAEAPEPRDEGFVTPEESEDGPEPEEYLTPRGGRRQSLPEPPAPGALAEGPRAAPAAEAASAGNALAGGALLPEAPPALGPLAEDPRAEAPAAEEVASSVGSAAAGAALLPEAPAPPPEPAPAPISGAADRQAELELQEEQPLVLLHCHGNATDIGLMMGPYYDMVRKLGIEVVGVEYSGYGDASGRPSASSCLRDVEAAYKYLTDERGVDPGRIVVYGQSVGSGPVAHLAANTRTTPVGGVVLHSPMLSGIKVVDPMPDSCCRPSCVWRCFDFYQNDRRARQFECPAFIMHGRHDEIIPFYHAHRLHQACQESIRWPAYFPNGANHNDLVEWDTRTYYTEVQRFLCEVRRIANGEEPTCPAARERRLRQVEVRPMAEVLSTVGSVRSTPAAGTGTVVPASVDDFIGGACVAEPRAGPEDGRYEKMRHGAGWTPNAA